MEDIPKTIEEEMEEEWERWSLNQTATSENKPHLGYPLLKRLIASLKLL